MCVCVCLCMSVLCAVCLAESITSPTGRSPLNSPWECWAGQREGRALAGSRVAALARLLSLSSWWSPLSHLGTLCELWGPLGAFHQVLALWRRGREGPGWFLKGPGGKGLILYPPLVFMTISPHLHLFWVKMLPLWTTFP